MLSLSRTKFSFSKPRAGQTRIGVVLAFLVFSLAGCSAPESATKSDVGAPKPAATDPVSETPEDLLYAQLRSGAFQLSAAAGSIEDSLVAAQEAASALQGKRDFRQAMLDVADFIDSAGSGISEFTDDPPIKDEIAKDFATHDERRLKAVEAANDALQDLRQALGLLDGLSEETDRDVLKWSGGVKALLAVALDDVWGAIEAFGGTPEGA